MTAFIVLMIGVLLFISLICRLIWRLVVHDTAAYDEQFLWEKYDLKRTELKR